MQITISSTGAERARASCVVVGLHEGRRPTPSFRALDGASRRRLGELVRRSPVRGKPGESLHLHDVRGIAADTVLVVGCGATGEMPPSRFLRIARAAASRLAATGARSAAWALSELIVEGRDHYWTTRQGIEALGDAAYRFDAMKSKKDEEAPGVGRLSLVLPGDADRAEAQRAIRDGRAFVAGCDLARDLGNLPPNLCTPTHLAERAAEIAKRHENVEAHALTEKEMEELGMGALLSVARGSRQPPRLVVLEYHGGKRRTAPVVLVGKGVTFDSGGISIKPAAAMDEMKYDMCGAASVLGTLQIAAELALPLNVIGLVPATENLPDGAASKPGDIVTSMSGQTVEILNTDAEGRLILCDALTYAARYRPGTIVDVATLTGACVVALGAHAHGLFANDDALGEALLAAGTYSGDRAWRLPLWEEYEEQLKSNFADFANVGGREAGAVTAASFLAKFTRDYHWAHLDIAGTAWRSGRDKGATGRPVRLLAQYLLDHASGREA